MFQSAHARSRALLSCALGTALLLGANQPAQQAPSPPKDPTPDYRFSGPFTHENLTIYLIHGDDQLKGKTFLTLGEALKGKQIIVHETSQVNQLAIENVCPDKEVFVLAGDIVKGGKQDRIIAYDLVVPAKSGKMPLASFCVENGRWTQRGSERPDQFAVSENNAGTKDLKVAVRKEMAQQQVWQEVAKTQAHIGMNVGGEVRAAASRTSLQLTLEDKKLQGAVEAYLKKLQPVLDGKDDVIGFAYAINGVVNSAEVFAANGLFRKLWPTLLKGSAVEAVAELRKDKPSQQVTEQAVRAFLVSAQQGKAKGKEVTKRVRCIEKETKDHLLYMCTDDAHPGVQLRASYIKK